MTAEESPSDQTVIERRIDALLRKMTRREKVALLSGRDAWNTVAIEGLGIPSVVMTDGPHGVRATRPEGDRKVGPATAFPTGISMAASWNPELVGRVGAVLGEETRAMGCDILLAPCVNIMRTPLAGRNFESYAELMQLFLRILRADLTVQETYVYTTSEPLDCAISVFGGLDDEKVSSDQLTAWQEQTRGAFKSRMFPGDHFFLRSARLQVLEAVHQDLRQILGQFDGGYSDGAC